MERRKFAVAIARRSVPSSSIPPTLSTRTRLEALSIFSCALSAPGAFADPCIGGGRTVSEKVRPYLRPPEPLWWAHCPYRVAAGQCRAHRRRPCAGLGPTCHRRAGRFPRRPAPAAHHRVRALRRRVRPRAGAAHRPPRRRSAAQPVEAARLAHPRTARARGDGRSRAAHRLRRQRPARHHARGRRSHLPAPLRRSGRSCGRRLHLRRQRLRRGSRPGRRRRRGTRRRRRPAATTCGVARGVRQPGHSGLRRGGRHGDRGCRTRVTRPSWRPSSTGRPAGRTASSAICCW